MDHFWIISAKVYSVTFPFTSKPDFSIEGSAMLSKKGTKMQKNLSKQKKSTASQEGPYRKADKFSIQSFTDLFAGLFGVAGQTFKHV